MIISMASVLHPFWWPPTLCASTMWLFIQLDVSWWDTSRCLKEHLHVSICISVLAFCHHHDNMPQLACRRMGHEYGAELNHQSFQLRRPIVRQLPDMWVSSETRAAWPIQPKLPAHRPINQIDAYYFGFWDCYTALSWPWITNTKVRNYEP